MGKGDLRFGLIGLGRHGSRYARHLLHDVAGAVLGAVCRRDRAAGEEFAAAHGVPFFEDWRELIWSPVVDAVAVVTPPALYLPISQETARAGKPLLLEKPLGTSPQEARAIVQAAAEARIPLMVAQTMRFSEVVQTLLAHKPSIGPVHMLVLSQRLEPSPLAWLDDPAAAGGGTILHTGIHLFDLVRYLMEDEVAQVSCVASRVFSRHLEDSFAALFTLRSGSVLCHLDSCRFAGGRTGRIELVGEKGQLMGDHIHNFACRVEGRQTTPLPVPPPVNTVCAALEAFTSCLQKGKEPPISGQDGLRAVEIAWACQRSAQLGETVHLP
ncbi:MAG: Gfo/Idh/MocA family oxidoreductase [Candidatus Tectomicrobia bacterium]|uniref:Gfo/Idh/MocA family oxidoreductase n=1 Tax=Tectimicrobiota bacterium TaxID=2528274 RepID=A0A932LZY9_UNCTE|nr:Gfo/Idh/MocA family oxidoreductase [Candidatus Tectomicrobia bacterium]